MGTFDGFIGNEKAKGEVTSLLSSGRLPHSYIISGESGTGKNTFAVMFAKALLCDGPIGGEPCGTCRSCCKVMSGSHPDLITVEKDDKHTAITVEQIRALSSDSLVVPNDSSRKVYIVREAGNMRAEAQNALLKTFEEPASFTDIMLLANDPEDLLPTVRSRAVEIAVKPVSSDEVKKYLVSKGYDGKKADAAARGAYGRIGRALKLAEENDGSQALAFEFVKRMMDGQELDFYEFGRANVTPKTDTESFLSQVMSLLRDGILICRNIKNVSLLSLPDREELIPLFHSASPGSLILLEKRTAEFGDRLLKHANFAAALMDYMCGCWEDIHG